jgi:hypothetical protein
MRTTDAKAWKMVQDHHYIIRQSVSAAIGGGYLREQDREDAISECEKTAYELAQREDVENYEHLLRRTLKWDLFRDNTRRGTDAMDHVIVHPAFQDDEDSNAEIKDQNSEDEPDGTPEFASSMPLKGDDIERAKARIKHIIDTRVLPRLQPLARMRFESERTIKRIANSTGRTAYDVDLRLRECWKLMFGRKRKAKNSTISPMESEQ